MVYEELRRLAAVKMLGQPAGHTLQPTALVHEAWLRLAGSEHQKWQGSRHFLAAAARCFFVLHFVFAVGTGVPVEGDPPGGVGVLIVNVTEGGDGSTLPAPSVAITLTV